MRGGGDRPEAVFVALEDGEVLGYAKLAFSEETGERAFHDSRMSSACTAAAASPPC